MEFTCSGIEVSFLEWQRNGESIGTFTRHSNGSEVQRVGPFVLILDSITMRSTGANVTSRLVGNISDFISGDRITCVGDTAEDSATVNYSQTGIMLSTIITFALYV